MVVLGDYTPPTPVCNLASEATGWSPEVSFRDSERPRAAKSLTFC